MFLVAVETAAAPYSLRRVMRYDCPPAAQLFSCWPPTMRSKSWSDVSRSPMAVVCRRRSAHNMASTGSGPSMRLTAKSSSPKSASWAGERWRANELSGLVQVRIVTERDMTR